MSRIAEKYIDDVLSGMVSVSEITRLTFERHKADIMVAPENGWYFDRKAVKKILDFCSLLKHSPDKRTWVPFQPDAWHVNGYDTIDPAGIQYLKTNENWTGIIGDLASVIQPYINDFIKQYPECKMSLQ